MHYRMLAYPAVIAFICQSIFTLAHAGPMELSGQFAVNESGAATYTIPIQVPPGTGGIEPKIALAYNSRHGNGLLGVGWSLAGLSTITRCPQTRAQDGAPRGINYDANDRFCLDGQRLVAISGTYGADGTQYRTEIDTFSNVISHGSAGTGPAWFEVRTQSGQTMEFGNTTDSRILVQNKPTAAAWALNKLSDTKTNYFKVSYTNDTTNGQFYPTRIDYTGNTATSLSTNNSVQFIYATRPDIVPRTTVRMSNVKTYTNSALVSDYRLSYQQSGAAQRSRITSIALCEAGGACLPATTMTWTNERPVAGAYTNMFNLWSMYFAAGPGTAWPDNNITPRMLADVNADGRPDIVAFGASGVSVSFNTGTSFAAPVTGVANFGTGAGWTDMNTFPRMLADVNGDGLPDIVGFGNTGVWVSLNIGGSGRFADPVVYFGTTTAAGGWSNNSITPRMLADVNGDGLLDVVGFKADGVYVSLNTGTSFAALTRWLADFGTNIGWSDNNQFPRMLADVNGDGLPDVVGFKDGGVWVSLNTGTSFPAPVKWIEDFCTNTNWSNNDRFPRMLVDVNGDGLLDIVGFKDGGVWVSLNTGTSFSTPTKWINNYFGTNQGWTSTTNRPRVLADVNGDGLPDIVGFGDVSGVLVSLNTGASFAAPVVWTNGWNFSAAGVVGAADYNVTPMYVTDVLGDGSAGLVGFAGAVAVDSKSGQPQPDLMSSITSGLGVYTTINYAPATNTSVVTRGTGTVFPSMDMIVPIYVVSGVTTDNGIGGAYKSSYTYSGPRFNIQGRGFLGFAQMTVQDMQSGITDTTNYLQDFPCIGLVASTTRKIGSQTLEQSTNTYQFVDKSGWMFASTLLSAPYRVMLSQNVSSRTDLDGSVLPTTTTTYQYDAYNNATRVVMSTSDGFKKTTTNTYQNDTAKWYLGRLLRSQVESTSP